MGPIKSRVFRAADGNTRRVVYALDGLRARNDLNGWEIETNVAQTLTKWNINVVMPIGGQSSFYTDWVAPSSFGPLGSSSGSGTGSASGSAGTGSASGSANQQVKYMWETFLTRDLRYALKDRLGFQPFRNGIFGLSMGGSAALTLAAYHPDQFNYAGSFSGFLNISVPGMPEAIRIAMLDAGGFNVDCMWPRFSPQWFRNDPLVFADLLKRENIRLFVASGNGVPGHYDIPNSLDAAVHVPIGMGLEALAFVNTQAFKVKMDIIGYHNVIWDFPPIGVHNWPYWVDNVNDMVPDMSAHIG